MADENLHGLPINSLPKADELNQTDQLIAYREDDGKAYRSNVGALAEASTANIGDAFATTVQYNAGDYCIYNDTLYKFTDFKDIGSWDDSVVEKVTVADEVKSNTEKIQENTDLIDSMDSLKLHVFSNTKSLLTQIDELEYETACFGYIVPSGNYELCELPLNGNFFVVSFEYGVNSATVFLFRLGNGEYLYQNVKSSAVWQGWCAISFSSI